MHDSRDDPRSRFSQLLAMATEPASREAQCAARTSLPDSVLELASRHCRMLPQLRGSAALMFEANQASSDIDQLDQWAADFPDCDWVLLTGANSGTVVLDIDADFDIGALRALNCVMEQETFRAQAGNKSLAFFRYPDEMHARRSGKIVLAPGLTVHLDDNLLALPPYTAGAWPDLSAPMLPAPEWLQQCVFEQNDYAVDPASLVRTRPKASSMLKIVGGKEWRDEEARTA